LEIKEKKTMATQYQQVLAAIKALDGKGTPKQIYEKIKETNPEGWKTKTPIASVSGYLSTNSVFKNENGIWVLQDIKIEEAKTQGADADIAKSIVKKADAKSERGLYFITLSPYIKISGAGFLFKIGMSGDVKKRLVAYSAALPVDTVQLISFYPIPDNVDLAEAEKEVTGELVGNENLGQDIFDRIITVRPYYGNHQDEWLQTIDINQSDAEGVNKLANIVDGIVKATIEALTIPPIEELPEA
jgi:hypothetical protein